MGKTIDFQQQKDLRVWRTVMEELRVIQNLEPWTFLGPEDTFCICQRRKTDGSFSAGCPLHPTKWS